MRIINYLKDHPGTPHLIWLTIFGFFVGLTRDTEPVGFLGGLLGAGVMFGIFGSIMLIGIILERFDR